MQPTITPTGEKDAKGREIFDFHFDGGGLYAPLTVRTFDEAYATGLWAEKRTQLPDKVVEIRCSEPGCGKVGGTIAFPANHPIDESKHAIEHGLIEDHRCDEHSARA